MNAMMGNMAMMMAGMGGMPTMPGMPTMGGATSSTAPATSSAQGGTFHGTLKSWNNATGYGFAQVPGSDDVYVSIEDCIDTVPQIGDTLSFTVEPAAIFRFKLKALAVRGGTGGGGCVSGSGTACAGGMLDQMGGLGTYGKMTGAGAVRLGSAPYLRPPGMAMDMSMCMGMGGAGLRPMAGPMAAASLPMAHMMQMPPVSAPSTAMPDGAPAPVLRPDGRLTGVVTAWFQDKKFGFAAIPGSDDVFVHYLQIRDGTVPKKGETLEFELESSKKNNGRMNWTAKNVTRPGNYEGGASHDA